MIGPAGKVRRLPHGVQGTALMGEFGASWHAATEILDPERRINGNAAMVLRASKASVCGCVPGDVGRRLSGRDEVEGRWHASLEASLNTSSIAQVCQQGVRHLRRNAATEEIPVVGPDAAATFVSAQRKRDRRYVVRVSGDAVGGPLFEGGEHLAWNRHGSSFEGARGIFEHFVRRLATRPPPFDDLRGAVFIQMFADGPGSIEI